MADDFDPTAAQGRRAQRELQDHLSWLESFTPLSLGILAVASGIYTYIGVTGLLEGDSAMSFFAAIAYSIAVSVGIFVFWSYVLRLLPAMDRTGGRVGLFLAMLLGCGAIVAMSSWLNAAALAGSAAVEQHLARTVQNYQAAVERANAQAVEAQALVREVQRARAKFQQLSEQEAAGDLSGAAGQGAVYAVLTQKAQELAALEAQILGQDARIAEVFEKGNAILSRMREIIAETGPVETRSVAFSEQSVRLAGVIATLRQLSVAPSVERAAKDLSASVVAPELAVNQGVRNAQSATMQAIGAALDYHSQALASAAQEVLATPQPGDIRYTPISTAEAVIRYAGDFVPSWAGAIAIDLLPGVLVFIMAVTQGAIRGHTRQLSLEQTMTLADLEAAISALDRIERRMESASAKGARARGPQPAEPEAAPPRPFPEAAE